MKLCPGSTLIERGKAEVLIDATTFMTPTVVIASKRMNADIARRITA
jgi:hypothetical protein